MTFVVFKKLEQEKALEIMPQIEQWFADNPDRDTCTTDLFEVRRGYVATDVLKHTNYEATENDNDK